MDLPYDPDGCEELGKELLKDFVRAPAPGAFGTRGPIQTVLDLNAAMVDIGQTPVPSMSVMLAALLPSDELATLSRGCLPRLENAGQQVRNRQPKEKFRSEVNQVK